MTGLLPADDRAAFDLLVLQLTSRDMEYHNRNGTTGLDTAWACYRAGQSSERSRLQAGHDRYEVARRMSPAQWRDAWVLNQRTGKPFDEIVADLAPFFGLRLLHLELGSPRR